MPEKLTADLIRKTTPPAKGSRIIRDTEIAGFGLRVTAADVRAFILNYSHHGIERRLTIGQLPAWSLAAAREEAKALRKRIDRGEDPLAERTAARGAPTVSDLCDRFVKDELPRKRASTRRDYTALIDKLIRPRIGSKKVAALEYGDVDALHRRLRKTPYRANRTLAVLSRMMSLAIKWRMRPDNPCKGVERFQEAKRTRYLTAAEIARLSRVLEARPKDDPAVAIIRLCLLTGARVGEVMGARWDQFSADRTTWTKPASTTKQKRMHAIPLSAPARAVLATIPEDGAYLFPSDSKTGHVETIKTAWSTIRQAAKIPDARVHDLRHSYASIIASSGGSLPLIGALLGHSNPATTHRYAHLFDDPLREATERVGVIVTGGPKAPVTRMRRRRA
jgi:integrase